MVVIIQDFRTIVFVFIVISSTFRLICPPAFFGCLLNSGTYTELRTTSFIESTGVACSDSVTHYRVHVLSIPVLFLSLRVFGLLSSSLLLFPQRFVRYVHRPSQVFVELGNLHETSNYVLYSYHWYPVMANEIRTDDSRGFNKRRSSKSRVGSRVRQTPEEGQRTY